MKVVILEYNAGNVRSVQHALHRIGIEATLSNDTEVIQKADKVIFPGVGEARSTMRYLRERGLDKIITSLKQPVLGICLGLQLLCSYSEENNTECLGIFKERVAKLQPDLSKSIKVPHMGWNSLTDVRGALFESIEPGSYVYFVHSYAAECGTHTSAVTCHGDTFSAALEYRNFYAVQFHPEKSGAHGEQLLRNFLAL